MFIYLTKRIIGLIPMFLGITLLSFFIIHLAPGKPSDISGELNPKVSLEVRQRIERLYDLDKPLLIQYGRWLNRLLRFDFGQSFSDGRPVSEKFFETIPITLCINTLSLFFIFIFGIPLGIACALRKDSFFDKFSSFFVFFFIAAPTFWVALLLMDLFGVKTGWLPVSGLKSLDFEYFNKFEKVLDLSRHLMLPLFVSSLSGLAVISRYMRQGMLQVLDKKYILGARARGIPEQVILYKHGLKNALLPIITILGLSIPGLIGGSVIFESIFSIPGTGRLFFIAVMGRDYPVIMAMLVLSALLTLGGNLLADVGYALADPRIKYMSKK
jgi:peptide/nickel transport system permease protein